MSTPKTKEKTVPAVPKPSPSDIVTVQVKVGKLGFEQGKFLKGSTFQVTRERAALFDKKDVTIL